MSSFDLMFIVGAVFILMLITVTFVIPTEKRFVKKKKENLDEKQQKDWKKTALRLEKLVSVLRNEIGKWENKDKVKDKQILVEKVKIKKLQEKIVQEKKLQEKEQSDIDRGVKELKGIRAELVKVQEEFSYEHNINLKAKREISDLKDQIENLGNDRRHLETNVLQMKTKADENRKEIMHLKKDNVELAKTKEDVSWIAKSDHIKLEKIVKEKEKEIERLQRELNS